MKEYFSHDHNARHDRKVVALVNKYKSSGYGIFWATNEMMHEEGGELELDEITFGAIATQLNEDVNLVESVIKDCINVFKLYIINDEKLTSNRVKRNLTRSLENKSAKSEAGRLGGIKSGESRKSKQNEATLEANEATLEATKHSIGKNSIGKEIIEKERKVKKSKEEIPENFSLTKIYGKKFNDLNGDFKDLTESGFLKWKDFVDFIIKNNFCEIFDCKFVTPQDFQKLEFPESQWEETIKLILSTGIKPEHNLFFRIPQFLKYGVDKSKGGTSANRSGISGTGIIRSDKEYKPRL